MAQNFPDEASVTEDCGETLEVHQCEKCGLVQLNSEPVPYYREVIRAAAFSDEMQSFRIKQFSDFVNSFSLQGERILEVGAGQGEYLQLMAKQDVQAFGTEWSDLPIQKNPERIFKCYLDSADCIVPEAPFKAFYCLNFMEHMPDPVSFLQAVHNNITPDGVGLIEVPNFDMVVKQKLFSEFIRDHLFYFTQASLSNLLENNGFEIISCKPVWHDYSLSAIVKKRSSTDLTGLIKDKTQIHQEIKKFTHDYTVQETAIWGAGHQALAVISLLELHQDFSFVVDSATFKQGKFTPASHLKILSPEAIKTHKTKAILIMAASYSDEVARIIRSEYSPDLKVAILRNSGLELV
ncbi:class I SAM-dependent methyltransferase [Neptuniibacter sp. UBA6509]|nr:class I SAM-dependent methyltransferase [Neptuniibacter sp. UBA6509]|tara:strand:+ start:28911 stop:29960 length:1050 start_codon:yes stop_codon:yes gene_type:complete